MHSLRISPFIPAVPCTGEAEAVVHSHIARTLRVAARHLPWVIARQIHAQHQDIGLEPRLVAQPLETVFKSIELEAFCWRVDVTDANVATAHALGWGVMRDLLRLASRHACEALELCPDHAVLPPELGFKVFEWP